MNFVGKFSKNLKSSSKGKHKNNSKNKLNHHTKSKLIGSKKNTPQTKFTSSEKGGEYCFYKSKSKDKKNIKIKTSTSSKNFFKNNRLDNSNDIKVHKIMNKDILNMKVQNKLISNNLISNYNWVFDSSKKIPIKDLSSNNKNPMKIMFGKFSDPLQFRQYSSYVSEEKNKKIKHKPQMTKGENTLVRPKDKHLKSSIISKSKKKIKIPIPSSKEKKYLASSPLNNCFGKNKTNFEFEYFGNNKKPKSQKKKVKKIQSERRIKNKDIKEKIKKIEITHSSKSPCKIIKSVIKNNFFEKNYCQKKNSQFLFGKGQIKINTFASPKSSYANKTLESKCISQRPKQINRLENDNNTTFLQYKNISSIPKK